MQDNTVSASAAAITQKATAVTGLGSFLGFIAKIDVMAWGGLIIAFLGLLIQLYFAIARNKREKAESKLRQDEYKIRINRLKEGCDVKQD